MNNKGIIGAIIGDIIGSRFEFNNYRSTDFQLFNDKCFFIDDYSNTISFKDYCNFIAFISGNGTVFTVKLSASIQIITRHFFLGCMF